MKKTKARYRTFAHTKKSRHNPIIKQSNTPKHILINLEDGNYSHPPSEYADIDAKGENFVWGTEEAQLAKKSRSENPSWSSFIQAEELRKNVSTLKMDIAENKKYVALLI